MPRPYGLTCTRTGTMSRAIASLRSGSRTRMYVRTSALLAVQWPRPARIRSLRSLLLLGLDHCTTVECRPTRAAQAPVQAPGFGPYSTLRAAFRGRLSPDPPWVAFGTPDRQVLILAGLGPVRSCGPRPCASSPDGPTATPGDGRLSGLAGCVSHYPGRSSIRFAHSAWGWQTSPGADLRQVTCLRLLPGQSGRCFACQPSHTRAGCDPARSGASTASLRLGADILRCSVTGRVPPFVLVPGPRAAPPPLTPAQPSGPVVPLLPLHLPLHHHLQGPAPARLASRGRGPGRLPVPSIAFGSVGPPVTGALQVPRCSGRLASHLTWTPSPPLPLASRFGCTSRHSDSGLPAYGGRSGASRLGLRPRPADPRTMGLRAPVRRSAAGTAGPALGPSDSLRLALP